MRSQRFGLFVFISLFVSVFFSSCEKKEIPVVLPPKGTATHARIDLGENYLIQIYYDLETGTVVKTSDLFSWDLALESSGEGYHVFMNGGKNVLINATGKTNFADVSDANVSTTNINNDGTWKYDDPDGQKGNTGVGEWRDASGNCQVYVVSADSTFYKFQLVSVDEKEYTMKFGSLNSTTPQTITIPKNSGFNYAYFSCKNTNHVVTPEPPKADWDLVFTRYRHVYKDLQNFKYIVTGALLNPNKMIGARDSVSGFANIKVSTLPDLDFVPNRDVIGFDWKSYDYTAGGDARYIVNPNKCFVIKNAQNQLWKIHFLDYYSVTGTKGSPSFEYERLQ